MLRLTPNDRQLAAEAIFRAHALQQAEELHEIIKHADKDIAEGLRTLVARFGWKDDR